MSSEITLILTLFAGVIVIKLLTNYVYVIKLKRFLRVYEQHFENHSQKKGTWELAENMEEIVKLFKIAKLQEPHFTHTKPLGFGHFQASVVSAWQNLPMLSDEVRIMNLNSFHQAIGYFRARRDEALSPFYWINFFLYAPRNLFAYIGFSPESAAVKAGQAIYWIVSLVAAIAAIVQLIK